MMRHKVCTSLDPSPQDGCNNGSQHIVLWENIVVVVALLFYVHSKHLRSCRDGQLT